MVVVVKKKDLELRIGVFSEFVKYSDILIVRVLFIVLDILDRVLLLFEGV